MESIRVKRLAIERKLTRLERQKSDMHLALMKEQQRAAKSRAHGQKIVEQQRWLPAIAHDKANSAEKVAGKKNVAIENKRRELNEQLSALRLPEVIVPTFSLTTSGCGNCTILSIGNGTVGYADKPHLLTRINLSLQSRDRVAILGKNGSGKSTLIRANSRQCGCGKIWRLESSQRGEHWIFGSTL
jgi:ATPase subunit of ABC transporter with duplicated ATPase domains